MNYTKNYRLPQWIKSDRIMMDDFNSAMGSIESGMSANAKTASDAMAAAGKAQSTADDALDAANGAKSTADTARKEAAVLPYATGSYTGSNQEQSITVGFRPSFVIISGAEAALDLNNYQGACYFCATGGTVLQDRCRIDNNGFTLFPQAGTKRYPHLNYPDRVYDYIAFR